MVDCTYEEKMIPKTIHYCWFGRNPKPKLAEKCIKSWKKKCPDYQIIEWNEDNFDISTCPLYVRQAFEAKKWAFVTDYVRLKVVYDHGGIYLDTDVELRKNLDFLLDNKAYFGFEEGKYIATGLGFGAEKGSWILDELMGDYLSIPFLLPDGKTDDTSCPMRNTKVFLRHGLVQNNQKQLLDGSILILPTEYLSPISFFSGEKHITSNTVSVHWFAASWVSSEKKEKYDKIRKNRIKMLRKQKLLDRIDYMLHLPNHILRYLLGVERYERIKKKIKRG